MQIIENMTWDGCNEISRQTYECNSLEDAVRDNLAQLQYWVLLELGETLVNEFLPALLIHFKTAQDQLHAGEPEPTPEILHSSSYAKEEIYAVWDYFMFFDEHHPLNSIPTFRDPEVVMEHLFALEFVRLAVAELEAGHPASAYQYVLAAQHATEKDTIVATKPGDDGFGEMKGLQYDIES